ncbi:unnamed protein product [Rotaria sp. Silwood1]|nr:unnamed protein product [Rotaria sp. Silwood1]
MAKPKGTVSFDRFVDVNEEPRKLLQPIEGYQSLELVSLEEAIEPIVEFCPDVRRRAYIAKDNCDPPKDGLTQDESASIFLYTTEWQPHDQCLYAVLNSVLRSKNRNRLISPWLLYMKLLLTALFKLRSCSMTVYRGVRLDLRKEYEVGKTYTWWGLSSCTGSVSVLESDLFLGQEGKRTMFHIECFNGKKIREHSSFEDEDEILLLPGNSGTTKKSEAIGASVEPKSDNVKGAASLPIKTAPTAAHKTATYGTKPDSGTTKKSEAIGASVEPKPDNIKGAASLPIKTAPTAAHKTATYGTKPGMLIQSYCQNNIRQLMFTVAYFIRSHS